MKGKDRFKRFSLKDFSRGQLTAFIILMLLNLLLGGLIPVLLSSNILFAIRPSREYVANELSDENLLSPISFSFIDEEQTARRQLEAAQVVIPYFNYSYSASLKMVDKAEMVYEYLIDGTPITDGSLEKVSVILARLDESASYGTDASIISESVSHFVNEGIFSSDDISYIISKNQSELFVNASDALPYSQEAKRLPVDSVVTVNSAASVIYQWLVMNYPDTDSLTLQVIADVVQEIIEANVFYDEVYTEALRKRAENSVEPVVINVEKGDYILKTDTLVTPEQLHTLDVLNSKRVVNMDFFSALPRFLLVFVLLIIWYLYSVSQIQYDYRKAQYTLIMLSMFAMYLIVGFFYAWKIVDVGFSTYVSLLPFLLVGMIGVSISNSLKYGISSILTLACMYSLWPNSAFYSVTYIVLCGTVVSRLVMKNQGRYEMISTCLKSSILLFIMTFFFSLLDSSSLLNMLFSSAGIILNVIFSFIRYSIILPILEKVFNIPTKQRLVELAYTDNAILNQLSQVAQGTYNHVKNVADLAYAAASAIGCNAELCLVGARYHDIGKMVHPEYFVENQNDKNAHDEISSQLSKSIIKSHVRLGTEKGKEIGLPQEVLDIISQHHGNDLIRYFYNEAVRSMGEQNVAKEDFMYDGVPPTSRESAIVMLADCVEAATRTLKRPNHQKYERMINSLVNERISFGQLDNSGLTMNEIKAIKEAFIPPLIGRDHHRISYDGEKE